MSDPDTGAEEQQRAHRNETPAERSDRNWIDLLQELRVMQTGIQILTAFLLTLPFRPRFADLDDFQVGTYLVLVVSSVVATTLLVAPVSLHRFTFQRQIKDRLVTTGHRFTRAALAAIAVVMTGVTLLVFDVVVNRAVGIIIAAIMLVLILLFWVLLPFRTSRGDDVS